MVLMDPTVPIAKIVNALVPTVLRMDQLVALATDLNLMLFLTTTTTPTPDVLMRLLVI